MSVSDAHIQIASMVLKSRLTRPSTVDINIINPFRISLSCKLDQMTGRYIGCFDTREGGDICFYLAARYHPDSQIKFLFVYYMNQDHSEIQQWDIDALKPYLTYIDDDEDPIQISIVNVKSSAHPRLHLSVLIEVVDYTIGYKMINNFQKVRYIDTDTRDLSIGTMKDCCLNHCDGNASDESLVNFRLWANDTKISFEVLDYPRTRFSGDAALVKVDGHFTGILIDKEDNFVNHLLIHRNQYLDQESYAKVVGWINSCLGNHELDHYCTRILPNKNIRCDDQMVWHAWRLSYAFRPLVFSIMKYNELLYLAGQPMCIWQNYLTRKFTRHHKNSFVEIPVGMNDNSRALSASQMSMTFSSDGRHTCSICDYDSQSTQVIEEHVWQRDWNVWLDVSRERRAIRDSLIPPVHRIRPHSDFTQSYLKYMLCYKEALELVCDIWNRYAPTVVIYRPLMAMDRDVPNRKGARFIIYALVNPNEGEDFLIVADQVMKKWILISASNREYKNSEYFDVSRTTVTNFEELWGFKHEAIPITSSFHSNCPRVHLLMSLYVMSRLFRYSVGLPQKIIYGEWEFRKYASNICTELQIVNTQYNIDNNLVDESGLLLEGAYESLPSPLTYELSVAAKDQCMFCKKRGFNNLGSHMSMRHGQKAQYANRKRSELN